MVSVDGNNISSNALNKASKVGNISQEQDSEQQKLEIRKAAAQNISIAYDNAINTLSKNMCKGSKYNMNNLWEMRQNAEVKH